MTKANECTCPSGDGSLRHPCPAHPAVEQAGGDERDFQAEGAQEVPSPVSQEYDRHLISLLRKGEALPGHQEEAADEIERLRDWNDHLNNTVLPNILNPNFLMLMKGGERLLDLCTKDGKFIGVSLNDMKDVFDWMVTHARIAPDHAALAQPSPTLPPFAEKVLTKLRRFNECAEDPGSGGVDIGRHWLDLLTQLGLLNRVQRSPALWEISQQGEDLLGTQQPSPAQAEHANSGYDQLWGWFGLSRSAYVVLPRVMMHAMPDDWQGRFAELMDEWDDHWPNQPDITAHVQIKQNNRFISTPPWLLNYRHPDHNQLNAMRGKDEL